MEGIRELSVEEKRSVKAHGLFVDTGVPFHCERLERGQGGTWKDEKSAPKVKLRDFAVTVYQDTLGCITHSILGTVYAAIVTF